MHQNFPALKILRIISQYKVTHRFQTPLVAEFGNNHIQKSCRSHLSDCYLRKYWENRIIGCSCCVATANRHPPN